MKWLTLGLMALGCALAGFGVRGTRTGASADERAGGALPIVLGAAIVALDLVAAFVWLVVRA